MKFSCNGLNWEQRTQKVLGHVAKLDLNEASKTD